MTVPGKLAVGADGKLTGPASISYNTPFPCVNGSWGSKGIQGVVMHTMVGNLAGTIAVFNQPGYQASADFGIDQQGHIHQFGPIGKGWIAWAQVAGNFAWYSIEHADNGDPNNPLTAAQITASAQLVECLSAFAGFPLQVTDSIAGAGYGVHSMGGAAWGGHTCVPAYSTELLTPEGWQLLGDARPGSLVAAWNPATGGISFSPVRRVVPLSLQDTIVRAGIEMTADHWLYVRRARESGSRYSLIPAASAHSRHEVPLAGLYDGPGIQISDDLLRLLVHIQADGHVMHSEYGPKGIEFHYRKARKIARMTGLLTGLGIDFKRADSSDGTTRIRVYDAAWARRVVLRWLPGREFSWEWLGLSARQFSIFHEELLIGDGCTASHSYATASQQSADVVMALHALHGHRTNRDIQGQIKFGRVERPGIPHASALSTFRVTGRVQVTVSCVTVDEGAVLIRQGRRRIAIIGNCPDLPPQHVRSAQRQAIIDLAKQIRAVHSVPLPSGRHVSDGTMTASSLAVRQGCDVIDLWWATAAGKPKPGSLQRAYVDAGTWDAVLPSGMLIWLP